MDQAKWLKELAEQIVQARKERGITQGELARAAGVSRKMLNALENGRVGDCGYLRLCAIAEALGYQITFAKKPRLRTVDI